MRYIEEESLTNFTFWGGAEENAKKLTYSELEQLDRILQDDIFDGDTPTDTQINDLFWFEFDTVADLLGLELDDNDDIVRD